MSHANVQYVTNHNRHLLNSTVVEICPNSIEPLNINVTKSEKEEIRMKYNIPINKTVFIYGGNLGKPQGIDFLVECIRSNEYNENSFFLIVGSGTEYSKLKNYFDIEKPSNAKLLNHLPKNDYEALVNS